MLFRLKREERRVLDKERSMCKSFVVEYSKVYLRIIKKIRKVVRWGKYYKRSDRGGRRCLGFILFCFVFLVVNRSY